MTESTHKDAELDRMLSEGTTGISIRGNNRNIKVNNAVIKGADIGVMVEQGKQIAVDGAEISGSKHGVVSIDSDLSLKRVKIK